MKIHCLEQEKEDFDKNTQEEISNMVGWIEPPDNDGWMVTMSDGCFFECKEQENAQILSSIEEVKALLMRK